MERADKRGTLGRSDSWPPLEIFRGAYGDERDAPAHASFKNIFLPHLSETATTFAGGVVGSLKLALKL
jgi:hypothetical protein